MAIHGLRLSVLICSYALISLAAGEDWWWPSHSSAGASASSSGSGSSSSASASSSSWGGGGSRASASAGSSSGGWGGSSSWASSSAFGSFIALTPGKSIIAKTLTGSQTNFQNQSCSFYTDHFYN